MKIIDRRALAGGVLAVPFIRPWRALGQTVMPGTMGSYTQLFESQGGSNGADTTEDTLATFTLAAGQLANVGDLLRLEASGTFGATTDNKVVKLKYGTGVCCQITAAAATNLIWWADSVVMLTGATAQRFAARGQFSGGTGTAQIVNGTLAQVSANALVVSVTGQNNTSSAAGSIVCNYYSVAFVKGA